MFTGAGFLCTAELGRSAPRHVGRLQPGDRSGPGAEPPARTRGEGRRPLQPVRYADFALALRLPSSFSGRDAVGDVGPRSWRQTTGAGVARTWPPSSQPGPERLQAPV